MTAPYHPDADSDPATREFYVLAQELASICRSITGRGVRETLRIIGREIPLTIHEVPTGTAVLDWTVPKEWNIRDAYIKSPEGLRLVDFRKCSLHVVGYSVPVKATMTRAELEPHLHSLPNRPSAVPYVTSYYRESWGFCLSQVQREQLGEGPFEVCIDSELKPGFLTYGECFLEGTEKEEVLISTHCCHPYMANDNLSGIGLSVQLAKKLRTIPRRFGYRFLFVPGTIGAIAWLAGNDSSRIGHGLVLTCLGDAGPFTYKRTRAGDAHIDRIVEHVLRTSGSSYSVEDFTPYGYDERQFNSPGFNLPVGCFMRTPHGRYEEYHTSEDNLAFLSPDALRKSLRALCEIIEAIESDQRFRNTHPFGEPQLGKRGLYDGSRDEIMALLWVLNLSDGDSGLLEIAERAHAPFRHVKEAADRLVAAGLLVPKGSA